MTFLAFTHCFGPRHYPFSFSGSLSLKRLCISGAEQDHQKLTFRNSNDGISFFECDISFTAYGLGRYTLLQK